MSFRDAHVPIWARACSPGIPDLIEDLSEKYMLETLLNAFNDPYFGYPCISILGLIIGSFLNVVVHRLPIMLKNQWTQECREFLASTTNASALSSLTNISTADHHASPAKNYDLAWPGSHCPRCGTLLKIWHNIPLLSFFCLQGKCASCHAPISWRYPLIECLTAGLSLWLFSHFGLSAQFAFASLLTFALIALTFIDLETQLLPDNITLPLIWLGLLLNMYGLFCPLADALLGAVSGYLSLWLMTKIFFLLTGKIGMGQGDFKLFAVFGSWLGWQYLPLVIMLACLIGLCFSMVRLCCGRLHFGTAIAFGPYLAIAGWFALLNGQSIYIWYLTQFI